MTADCITVVVITMLRSSSNVNRHDRGPAEDVPCYSIPSELRKVSIKYSQAQSGTVRYSQVQSGTVRYSQARSK